MRGVFQGLRRHYRLDAKLLAFTHWVDGVEVGRNVILEVRQADVDAFAESGRWAGLQLKDVRPSE